MMQARSGEGQREAELALHLRRKGREWEVVRELEVMVEGVSL